MIINYFSVRDHIRSDSDDDDDNNRSSVTNIFSFRVRCSTRWGFATEKYFPK